MLSISSCDQAFFIYGKRYMFKNSVLCSFAPVAVRPVSACVLVLLLLPDDIWPFAGKGVDRAA